MGKRGQFFLFAAVVIGVLVVTFGSVINSVRSPSVQDNTDDIAVLVSRETGKVIDYEVYNARSGDVESFVDSLALEIREKDPEANFLFIIGDRNTAELRNYGSELVEVCRDDPGVRTRTECINTRAANLKIKSSIRSGSVTTPVTGSYQDYSSGDVSRRELWVAPLNNLGSSPVVLSVRDQEFEFFLSDNKQVIFIVQKDVGGESYVAVE